MLPLLLLPLMACDTGTPGYWHLAPERISAGGMTYDVRVNGLMAEALRQNMMLYPRFRDVASNAALAIAQVSQCRVLEMRGDPSIVEARLECAGQKAPKFTKARRMSYCSVTYTPPDASGVGTASAACQ